MKHIYSSIDIGSDSIKIVVCELFKNKLNLLAATSCKSKGIKKGLITDVELASLAIKQALNEVESMLNIRIKKLIVSVPSYLAEYSIVKGNVKISDNIVTYDDVMNCLKESIKSKVISGKEMVTILPIDYKIDNNSGIVEPVGMTGINIESRAVLVVVPKKNIYSVVGVLENIGIEVVDISLNNIGDLYAFKNNNFDSKIAAIINIGSEITSVSIYNRNVIIKSSILNMGGRNIDNDISYAYKIEEDLAKTIKTKFAVAHTKYASSNDFYEIKKENGILKVSQLEVSEIVMSRLEEILNLTKNELNNLTSKQIDYIIITGGVVNTAGFEHLVSDIFPNETNIGNIKILGIRNCKYSACVGNIVYFINKLKLKGKDYTIIDDDEASGMISSGSRNTSESMLGKVCGFFFNE